MRTSILPSRRINRPSKMTWPLTGGNVNSESRFLQRRNRILLSKLKRLVMKHTQR